MPAGPRLEVTTEPPHSKHIDKEDKRSLRQRLTDFLYPPPATPEELIEIIAAAEECDTIKPDVRIMLERVIRLEQLTASDAMVSTSRMDLLDIDASYEDLLDKVIRDAHSRFPVYEGSRDNIIGVLLAKHLLQLQRSSDLNVRALLRPPLVLPETKRLSDLLREFRLHRNHMAILVDEFGRTSGLITIEDVLEEIVGEIEDEFDEPEDEGEIYQLANGSWRVRGDTPIEKVEESFEVRLTPEDFDDDIETIGGLITQQLGRVPARGEVVGLAQLQFEVLFAKGGAVRWFRVSRQEG